MSTDAIETREVFSTAHTKTKNVFCRFLRMIDQFTLEQGSLDWRAVPQDNEFEATEVTLMGDGTNSQYLVTLDLKDFNNNIKPGQFMAQFVEKGGSIIATDKFWVVSGRRADIPRTRLG